MKKALLILILLTSFFYEARSSHIVGGDIHFEQTGPNTFFVTLRTFRDWCNGIDFNATITARVYDNVTNASITSVTLTRTRRDTTIFGDECYTPTGICNSVQFFTGTVTLPDNPNGYYCSYTTSNRNSSITNIDYLAGKVWYCQIPDPALAGGNDSPKFPDYPSDGYLCINNLKTLDLSCTDADGDSLVYSLVTPTDNGTTKPFTLANWEPGYSLTNILGPGSLMTIDPLTGIISARPGAAGVYVFAVRCEEYRNGVKIGEVELDLQYEALNCTYDLPPEFAPFPNIAEFDFDQAGCFDIVATDPNTTDPFNIAINSNAYGFGASISLPPVNTTPAGTYTFNYLDTTTGTPASITAAVTQTGPIEFQGSGAVGARFCWQPDSCEVLSIDTFRIEVLAFSIGCDSLRDTISREVTIDIASADYVPFTPNVFSPNNDGLNDVYELPASEYDRCYDVLNVEIYNRWGKKVFESDDPLFKWDGTDEDGTEMKAGTYYILLQGFYGGEEVTNQFPVTLFR